MKKRIWVNRAGSFSEAEEFDDKYRKAQTATERLDEMQFLREQYFKMNQEAGDAHRKGLRRAIRIIKQTSG
ncbi:MAG: hypothetical protein JW883_17035 [Deltaproteobacteria bacterium]|nr:hypothetical protein [Deltaproteobacteria bacterium]